MSVLTFDTHEAIKRLMNAGLPEEQAEAVTGMVRESQEAHLEELVTKGDLKSEITFLRKELGSEIALLRKDMERMGDHLMLRLGALMIAVGGVILAYLELRGGA